MTAMRKGQLTVAGLLVGQLLAVILDHVIGGPGAFAIFGL